MSSWSSIDAVYLLCHPEKEPSRWQRLQEHLVARGVPKEKWVQMAPTAGCQIKDPSGSKFGTRGCTVNLPLSFDGTWGDELDTNIFELYDPFTPRACPYLCWKGRALSKGEISLVLNFWSAVDDALEKGYTNIIVFESDVFLRDDFTGRLGDLMKILSTRPWDFVSLSDGVGTRAIEERSMYAPTEVHIPPHQFPFRCTDSMLFRVEILRKMRRTAFPFRECLDWELNYQLAAHGGVALWVEPHLVEQGTCKGRMSTSLPS